MGEPTETRRVSGSNKRQRTESKLVRFTPAELVEAENGANRFGLTLAGFLRASSLSAARGESGVAAMPVRSLRVPPVEKELLARALGQLGKVGSNLNQIAHAANVGADELDDLTGTLREVREVAQAIMQAMGRAS